ncbi:MAG: transposase [Longimicrobiales bacterium]
MATPVAAARRPSPDLLALLAEIRETRFAAGVVCVRCHSPRVRRHGTFAGRQRYRCNTCRRTFSDLTGTPAAYLKRLERLPDYRTCMAASLSVRVSARAVGVHPTTSFRWRHRLLKGMAASHEQWLFGLVEIEEAWVLCTDRMSDWPFRRRPRRSLADPNERRSWLVALCDRQGHSVIAFQGDERRPDRVTWARAFPHVVGPSATIITRHGQLSAQAAAARDNALACWHRTSPARRGANASLYHVRTAAGLLHRYRRWLRRFRGVTTRYLDNYTVWHGLIDERRRSAWRMADLLRWPCVAPTAVQQFPRTDAYGRQETQVNPPCYIDPATGRQSSPR